MTLGIRETSEDSHTRRDRKTEGGARENYAWLGGVDIGRWFTGRFFGGRRFFPKLNVGSWQGLRALVLTAPCKRDLVVPSGSKPLCWYFVGGTKGEPDRLVIRFADPDICARAAPALSL